MLNLTMKAALGAAIATTTIATVAAVPASSAARTSMSITVAATEVIEGKIVRVNLETNEFRLLVDEKDGVSLKPTEISIKVTDKTSYTLDGKPSTKAVALQTDRRAVVAHEDRVALKIDVTTPKRPN